MNKRLPTLVAALAMLGATQSRAGITAISDDFNVNTGTFPSWISVGSFATTIAYDAVSTFDYDTNDLINTQFSLLDGDGIIGNLAGDTEPVGDGLLADGGLRLNTQNATVGDEAIGLTLGGTMSLGELYTFTAGIYNDNTSFWSGRLQLFNLTANTLLAETTSATILGNGSGSYRPLTWNISYTAQAGDVGNLLQIRVVEDANSASRDGYLDNFGLAVQVPEPSASALLAFGFGVVSIAMRRRTR